MEGGGGVHKYLGGSRRAQALGDRGTFQGCTRPRLVYDAGVELAVARERPW